MKLAEIRGLDDEALDKHVAEGREELMKLRFQLATGALENSARIGQVKRDIARMLTVRSSRVVRAGAPATTTTPAAATSTVEAPAAASTEQDDAGDESTKDDA